MLFTNKFHFFPSFNDCFKSFTEIPGTLLKSSIHLTKSFPFFVAPADILSKNYCALVTCPKNRIFIIFTWLLTKCLLLLSEKFLYLFSPSCPRHSKHFPLYPLFKCIKFFILLAHMTIGNTNVSVILSRRNMVSIDIYCHKCPAIDLLYNFK